MEHIKTQLHVHDMNNTCNAFNKNNTCNDITCSTYETIPKREYGLLLRKMESWGITAPKAIVKKYGVFIVKRAVEYTLATPNVRNKAGYMTYMCNQFKSEATMPVEEKKEEKRINTPKEDLTQPQTNSEQRKSDVLPQVNSYKDARNFICDFYDGLYEENDNVIEFVRKIKKQYNFA